MFGKRDIARIPFLLALISCTLKVTTSQSQFDVKLGAAFLTNSIEEVSAFKEAIKQSKNVSPNFTLSYEKIEDTIELGNSFNVGNAVCSLLKNDATIIYGLLDSSTISCANSFCETYNVPFVTANPLSPQQSLVTIPENMLLSLYPSPSELLEDLINYYKWKKILYLYDDDEGLFRFQALFTSLSGKGINAELLGFNIRDVGVLDLVKSSGFWYIIIDSTSQISWENTKAALSQRKMISRSYHYVILNFDIKNTKTDEFREEGWFFSANFTGFNIIQTENKHYKSLQSRWKLLGYEEGPPKFSSILTYDSVLVVAEAIKLMWKNETINLKSDRSNIECAQKSPTKLYGKQILNYMKQARIEGITGRIQFAENGIRTNYSVEIYENTYDGMKKVGNWNQAQGVTIIQNNDTSKDVIPERKIPINLFNKTYRIITVESKPYFMEKENVDEFTDFQDKYEGYAVDLAQELSKRLNFSYKFAFSYDKNYGSIINKTTNEWNGMVRDLIEKRADMAIASMTITSEREEYIDFSKPFMDVGVSVLIKKPIEKKPDVLSFLRPFSNEIWMSTLFAYIAVSVVLFLVSRFSPSEWHEDESAIALQGDSGSGEPRKVNDFGIFNSLWFALGAWMQQGSEYCPRSLPGRIVGTVWWFFTLIIISSYTANLAAFLTVQGMVSPINSASDLASQTEILYGCLDSGATKTFFQSSKISTYQRMWAYMKSVQPSVFAQNTSEGVARVRSSDGKYAFLMESAVNEYYNERLPCDTVKVGENLDSKGYGVGMQKNSDLKDPITLTILELREDSTLNRLKDKWWVERGECPKEDTKADGGASELGLSNVAGIFYILIGGLVLGMVVAICEFFYKSKKDSMRAKKPLPDTMKAQAKLSLKGMKGDYALYSRTGQKEYSNTSLPNTMTVMTSMGSMPSSYSGINTQV